MYVHTTTRTALFALITLASACGPWPTGEVCDQRNQLLFAGMLANAPGKMCETHDYDDDTWPAAYDADDRLDRDDNDPRNIAPQDGETGDIDGDGPDGRRTGPIEECIPDTPDNAWREGDRFWDQTVAFDWDCVTAYWATQLDGLCVAWEDGTFPFETHVVDKIDDNHYEREAEAYQEYCR